MSRVDVSKRICGIQMKVMFTGVSKIGSRYSVVCEYPKNDFVVSSCADTRVSTIFDMQEYHRILETQSLREFDTVVFDATIKHYRYGTVEASNIKVTECIRNSPIE
jgi:hypothetical protein